MDTISTFIQPLTCAATGEPFGNGKTAVVLKCGCVVSNTVVESIITDTGFMSCPVCEYSYVAKSKADALKVNEADTGVIVAQSKRCAVFLKQISKLQEEIDVMFDGGDLVIPDESSASSDEEGNQKPPKPLPTDEASQLMYLSSSSSVADSSMDDEEPDQFKFESTEMYRLRKRLKNLRAKRDELVKKKADKLKIGKKNGSKWAEGEVKYRPNGMKAAFLAARASRRAARAARRAQSEEKRAKSAGSKLVVHDVDILGKNVPKKWRKADPNAVLTAAEELKAREKKGWLNEEEQELDEEQQEVLKEQRRAEWKKAQGPIPKLPGSVKRYSWALRLHKLARRKHLASEAIAKFEEEGSDPAKNTAARWQARMLAHEARVEATRAKIATVITTLRAAKKSEKAVQMETYFADAEQLGKDELAAELAAKKAAEEAAAAAEKQRIKDEKKAAKKERRRKEAEEKGEDFDEEAAVSTDEEGEEAPAAEGEEPAAEEGAKEETAEE